MISYAVIGLGFGDEGKGKVVSSLCEKHKDKNCIVARYSGGSQASHKVVYKNIEHTFSNFGSGTLQNIPTYWTEYCSFNPLSFIAEYKDLILKNKQPLIYIHPKCPITTPYEILANQQCKTTISHGTCGQGIGKTFQREEDWFSLLFEDLHHPKILEQKLFNIRQYYNFDVDKEMLDDFLNICHYIVREKNVRDYTEIIGLYDVIIYEGSQGLLLDQHNGFFPHVTRANTGLTNILEMREYLNGVYYVTRSYLTKHGNGNEIVMNEAEFENPYEHNTFNEWQGRFKTGILDLDLISYAMNKNRHSYNAGIKNVVVNCMDIFERGKTSYSVIKGGKKIENLDSDSLFDLICHSGLFTNIVSSGDYKEIIKL